MTQVLLEKSNMPAGGDEDVGQYLKEIRRYPLLDDKQEQELAKACARGEEAAVRTMVNSNLRLVVSVAREYAGRGVPLLDLIQEGSIGLLAAAKKFDHTKNCRFSTYASKWIHQAIRRYLYQHSEMIRVPEYTAQQLGKVLAAKASLEKAGQDATIEMISEASGLPEEKVDELLQLQVRVCSLDAPMGENETSSLQFRLEDLQAPQPQEEMVRRELKCTMDALLGQLPDRQRQVLTLYYGMEDGTCHSLERIGILLHISKERARQIKNQALEKMQKMGTSLGLEDFLDD